MPWNCVYSTLPMSCRFRPRACRAHSSTSSLSKAFLQSWPSCRSFHSSPRPQFLEAVISPAHTFFEGVHTLTGLPWAYTIPIAALSIRTIFVLPINIYSRRVQQKQVALAPLVQSWDHQLKRDAIKEAGHLGPAAATSAVLKKLRRKRNEIYNRMGCQTWKAWLPIFQLPVFLVAVESLRVMSGAREGLLALLAASMIGGDPAAVIDGAVAMREFFFEPGLITGGALWFPDLTKADPELRLSFILSGVMLFNLVRFSPSTLKPSIWQTRLRRVLGIMALSAGPLLCEIPSGMLVYWISSSLVAQCQGYLLGKLMPIKQFTPCKPRKPLRIGRTMMNKTP